MMRPAKISRTAYVITGTLVAVCVCLQFCCKETSDKNVGDAAGQPSEKKPYWMKSEETVIPDVKPSVSDVDPVNLFYLQERWVDQNDAENKKTCYAAVRQNWKDREGSVLYTSESRLWMEISGDFTFLYQLFQYRNSNEKPNWYIDENVRITNLRSGEEQYLFGPDFFDLYRIQNKLDSAIVTIQSHGFYNPGNCLFFITSSSFGSYHNGKINQIRNISSDLIVTHLIPYSSSEAYCHYFKYEDTKKGGSKKRRVGIYNFSTNSIKELEPRGLDTLLTNTSIACDTRLILAYRGIFSSTAEYTIDFIDSTYALVHRVVYNAQETVSDIIIGPYGKWVYFSDDSGISRIKTDDLLSQPAIDGTWFARHREVLYSCPVVRGMEYTVSNLRIMKKKWADK